MRVPDFPPIPVVAGALLAKGGSDRIGQRPGAPADRAADWSTGPPLLTVFDGAPNGLHKLSAEWLLTLTPCQRYGWSC